MWCPTNAVKQLFDEISFNPGHLLTCRSEPIRTLEIRYPKLNFNILLKFNFGYRISTWFQSSHIRSLLIAKQSLLNFKLIRFSWYEHYIYIYIYIYIYNVIKYTMSLLFTWKAQWPSYITPSLNRPPTIFSFRILLCFLSYLLTSPLFCPISGGFKFSFGIEILMNTK